MVTCEQSPALPSGVTSQTRVGSFARAGILLPAERRPPAAMYPAAPWNAWRHLPQYFLSVAMPSPKTFCETEDLHCSPAGPTSGCHLISPESLFCLPYCSRSQAYPVVPAQVRSSLRAPRLALANGGHDPVRRNLASPTKPGKEVPKP